MADWYCGSVQYAAVAQWAASAAVTVGQIKRQLATPAVGNERCFRVTTAGTTGASEPAWNLGAAATTTSGTAVLTEVTGNVTYNWAAPSARLLLAQTRAAAGDRVFVAHNHAETQAANNTITSNGTSANPIKAFCVDAAGSVPPVSADLRTTGTLATTGAFNIAMSTSFAYYYGLAFNSNLQVTFTATTSDYHFEACAFSGNNASTTINIASSTHQNIHLDNCSFSFAATNHAIEVVGANLVWRNSTAVTGATIPTTLVNFANAVRGTLLTCDGVDFSMLGSGKTLFATMTSGETKVNLANCKLDSAVTITNGLARGSEINLVNCQGHSRLRVAFGGTVDKETTIVRSGGASDGVETISWKVVTDTNTNAAFPFECYPIAEWNGATGVSVTATIEVITDGVTLTNADLFVDVEYLGTSSSNLASRATSGPADLLASGSNLASSTVTWTTTGLASPIKQKITVSFTPQKAGLVRLTFKIAKVSTTLYIDPKVTLA